MKFFLILSLLFFIPLSHGKITIISHDMNSKTSNYNINDDNLEIWGSTTGTCTHNTTSNGTADVCNSCAENLNKEEPCHNKKISPSSNVTINFTFSKNIQTSYPFLRYGDQVLTIESGSTVNGQVATLVFNWADVCSALSYNDNTCSSIDRGMFTFGVADTFDTDIQETMQMRVYTVTVLPSDISPDCSNSASGSAPYNLGVRDFSILPSDEKIYIPGAKHKDIAKEVLTFCDDTGIYNGNAPAGGNIKNLILFYNFTDLASVDTSSLSLTIPLIGHFPHETLLTKNSMDNLFNGYPIFVKMAVQDQAGNILDLSPTMAEIAADSVCNGIDSTSTDTDILNCKYSATPRR